MMTDVNPTYPSPESQGGWRWLGRPDDVRTVAGMDAPKLEQLFELPTDMFAFEGYKSNRCYVIPSLDLVVARVGSGPPRWHEQEFIGGVVAAIIV